MKNVFLALCDEISSSVLSIQNGIYAARWLHDISVVAELVREGWTVYRVRGLELIEEVIIDLKVRKNDANDQSTESPKPNN